MISLRLTVAAAAAVASFCTSVQASSVNLSSIDGVKGAGEYDNSQFSVTRNSFVNGSDSTGGIQTTTRYFNVDSDYVYLAIEADPSTFANKPGPFVNGYLYSSGYQIKTGGGTGSYGDGDDVILEGTDHWLFARDGTNNVWSSLGGTLTKIATNVYADTTNGVYIGYDGQSNFWEAAVKKSLINYGLYDSVRIGGQAWAYDLTFDNAPVSPNAGGPVTPLPAAVVGGAALLGCVGLKRRWAVASA